MSTASSNEEAIRKSVRDRYGGLARGEAETCCGSGASYGCPPSTSSSAEGAPSTGGCCGHYTESELAMLPPGAELGLGCGSPTRLANLHSGETVLDLGSGAGADCFLSAGGVGPSGHVIGVDFTPDMVSRARRLAATSGRANVEFRLGEIEHLPVADSSVDVVLSNCVINLAPDKGVVYREAFRVLRPGGRLAVSDVIAPRPIPEAARNNPELWSSCSSGALSRAEVTDLLRAAGFESIEVVLHDDAPPSENLASQAEVGVVAGEVLAVKPSERPP